MPAPKKSNRPAVPPVLAAADLDNRDPAAFKKALAAFGKVVEAKLATYAVTHYVVARYDQGIKTHVEVIPCSNVPEQRVGDAALPLETGGTAADVADAVVRAGSARPAIKDPAAAKGLAPKKGGGVGVGLRKR
jgi:hypothetical protein